MLKPVLSLLVTSAVVALQPAVAFAAEPLFAPAPVVTAELPVPSVPPLYAAPPAAPVRGAPVPACAPVPCYTPAPVYVAPPTPAPTPVYSAPTVAPVAAAPVAPPPSGKPAPPPVDASKLPQVSVPRVFSIGVGWVYSPVNTLPITNAPGLKVQSQGILVEPQLLWQVRGFARGWPAWVGFGTSFHYLFGGSIGGAKDSFGLSYGVAVKHALFPRGRFRLYANYGLGAAQMWVRENNGRGVGHLTKLALGADIRLHRIVQTSIEVAYRYINIPLFSSPSNTVDGFDLHAVGLTLGLWIGK